MRVPLMATHICKLSSLCIRFESTMYPRCTEDERRDPPNGQEILYFLYNQFTPLHSRHFIFLSIW